MLQRLAESLHPLLSGAEVQQVCSPEPSAIGLLPVTDSSGSSPQAHEQIPCASLEAPAPDACVTELCMQGAVEIVRTCAILGGADVSACADLQNGYEVVRTRRGMRVLPLAPVARPLCLVPLSGLSPLLSAMTH